MRVCRRPKCMVDVIFLRIRYICSGRCTDERGLVYGLILIDPLSYCLADCAYPKRSPQPQFMVHKTNSQSIKRRKFDLSPEALQLLASSALCLLLDSRSMRQHCLKLGYLRYLYSFAHFSDAQAQRFTDLLTAPSQLHIRTAP